MSKERISDLRKSLNGKEYGKRYSIWQKILEEATKLDFQFKCELYSDFVQEFPFTYHEWNDFAQLYAKNNDRTSALKIYEWGVSLNKRSLKLWECLCSWTEHTFAEDKDLVRKTFDKATAFVGLDYFSGTIWNMYLNYEEKQEDLQRLNTLFWRLVSIPIKDIAGYELRFKKFIDKIDDAEILKGFIKSLGSTYAESANLGTATLDQLKTTIKSLYSSYALQTNALAEQRKKYEEKVSLVDYHGEDLPKEEKLAWIDLIDFEKGISANQPPKIIFMIEKALTYAGTSPEVWAVYIQYLENIQGDRKYLKSSLTAYKNMLLQVNLQAIFVLADIYELDSEIDKARDLYKSLIEMRPSNPEINQKYCEFEIRHGEYQSAVDVYERLLFKGTINTTSKAFLLGQLVDLLRAQNDTTKLKEVVENAVNNLPYHRIILNIYLVYLKEFLDYPSMIKEMVKMFESALTKSKAISNKEFNISLNLYTKTMRKVSKDISIIFKVEKNLSQRYSVPKEKFDVLWIEYSKKLIKDIEEHDFSSKEDPKEPENGVNGEGLLGKREGPEAPENGEVGIQDDSLQKKLKTESEN